MSFLSEVEGYDEIHYIHKLCETTEAEARTVQLVWTRFQRIFRRLVPREQRRKCPIDPVSG
ncbi:hypothetical protein [Nitrosomonas sp. PY1]|uniref:hypothetical protein n=1 Tax=Nitrosomonas sp. PY1 TaxID=1803906 RepID=UPI001FC8C36F|nr:hypothetical protein [Nitrosomonas sp. PY1]